MKKSKCTKKSTSVVAEEKAPKAEKKSEKEDLDDEEQGFGGWLRSSEGLDTMKLFVIANSIVMLTTLAYPHIQTVVDIITDAFYGPDAFYPLEITY